VSSKKELVDNYNAKRTEIEQLKTFYNSIVPDSLQAYIEFEDEHETTLKVFTKPDPAQPWYQSVIFQDWNFNPYDYKRQTNEPIVGEKELTFEKTCRLLKWDNSTFKKIKHMLDKANCISVTNGEPTNIGFKRSGMGMYFYNLFEQPIIDKAKYNDSCQYILYNDKTALEFGGGAVGAQCFPDGKN
jgi:hypothetical protein